MINIITLDNLLSMPSLADLVIVAGYNGASIKINKVTVLDAPDGPKWLRGKEFVLTSTYIFDGDTAKLYKFVKNLIDVGASGLGIKTDRYLKEIPKEVLELAEKNKFPIIKIPYKIVWSDIIGPFYELWYRVNSSDNIERFRYSKIEQIYEASKWGSKQFMMKLTESFNVPMVVMKKNKKIIADNTLPEVEHLYRIINDSNFFPDNMTDEILSIDDYFLAVYSISLSWEQQKEYIVIMSKSQNLMNEISELFKLLATLKRQDTPHMNNREQLYRSFISSVVSGKITSNEINNFEKNRKHTGTVHSGIILITGENIMEVYGELKFYLERLKVLKEIDAFSYIFYDKINNEGVVMLELSSKERHNNINVWLRILMNKFDNLDLTQNSNYIFVGNLYESLSNIADSYYEACESKKIGRILWKDEQIYLFSDLAVYSLFRKSDYTKIDLGDIDLLEFNHKLSYDGITTLETFIESGSYSKAAVKLYVHENTLRYRIKKIGELLNVNLEEPVVCYRLLNKIKLWRLKNI